MERQNAFPVPTSPETTLVQLDYFYSKETMPTKKKSSQKKKIQKQNPVHPGIVLEQFLTNYNLTPYRLAREIKIDASLIGKIIKGDRPISPLVSLALGKFFGIDEAYWIMLQVKYDLGVTKIDKDILIHSIRTVEELD